MVHSQVDWAFAFRITQANLNLGAVGTLQGGSNQFLEELADLGGENVTLLRLRTGSADSLSQRNLRLLDLVRRIFGFREWNIRLQFLAQFQIAVHSIAEVLEDARILVSGCGMRGRVLPKGNGKTVSGQNADSGHLKDSLQ